MLTKDNRQAMAIYFAKEIEHVNSWKEALHVAVMAIYEEIGSSDVDEANEQLRKEAEECITNHIELGQACKKEVIIEWVVENLN